LTEVETANGYTLLTEKIHVTLTASETDTSCGIYGEDTLGVLQNDARYSFPETGFELANIPQVGLAHKLLTAAAVVRTDTATESAKATMAKDEVHDSANAIATLKIINHPGIDMPATGDVGTVVFSAVGISLMAVAGIVILFLLRKRDNRETA